jgi:hypothetical protein
MGLNLVMEQINAVWALVASDNVLFQVRLQVTL